MRRNAPCERAIGHAGEARRRTTLRCGAQVPIAQSVVARMPTFASRARRLAGLVAAAALATLVSATAFAVPTHEGTVSAAAPTFAWDGGPANGSGQGVSQVRCTPLVYECEDTLIEVKDPGDLFAEIKAGDGANDLDVAIYKSDASGTTDSAPGADNPDTEDVSTGKDAKTTLKKVTPGFYIVRVRIFDGIQATWKGTATLKTAASAPAPAPVTTTPPSSTAPQQSEPPKTKPSAKERRNACKKKAKKIKNKKKRAKAMKRCKKIR